jgi:membrane protein DedA with SNARE-associated domain
MDAWLEAVAASPWLLAVLFALVVGDAFLVVLPSETLVVALGALAAATGQPPLWLVVPVAAAGAVVGDSACVAIGRAVGTERWGWQRRGRVGRAIRRTRGIVLSRPATLILTARYIPFARIAVNLSVGAARLPWRRFLPLSALAGTAWAVYNVAIGALFGTVFADTPWLGILVSVPVAVVVGALVDLLFRRRAAYAGGMSSDDKPTTASEETKRKFREALDRKKQQQHDRPAHLEGESAVHEAHNKAGGKREFRRKSG